mmetsp:Transcript_2764/g.5058  ORF Transcript_2764/g.5058 Transcript_2764/m.5058 type:complete len:205 (+) Transcript_2764:1481-2095(+)
MAPSAPRLDATTPKMHNPIRSCWNAQRATAALPRSIVPAIATTIVTEKIAAVKYAVGFTNAFQSTAMLAKRLDSTAGVSRLEPRRAFRPEKDREWMKVPVRSAAAPIGLFLRPQRYVVWWQLARDRSYPVRLEWSGRLWTVPTLWSHDVCVVSRVRMNPDPADCRRTLRRPLRGRDQSIPSPCYAEQAVLLGFPFVRCVPDLRA